MGGLKQFKKTAFWIVLLVALAGVFSLIDERAEVAQKIEAANLKLLPFSAADVEEFWTKSKEKGVQVRAVREKDGWWMTSPLRVKGDQEAIEKLLKNVVKTRKDAVLFENPGVEKEKELGLDDPEREFGVRAKGKETIIQLGDKGPTLNIAYARFQGENRIFRIHSDVRREAGSTVYSLRDKTVIGVDPANFRRLELTRKGMDNVVIVHDQGKWSMVEPFEARASQTKVLETLFDLKKAEVKEFIEEEPSDLKSYGLDAPAIKVSVLAHGQDRPLVLNIGDRDRTKRGYNANNDGAKKVFLVEEDLANALKAQASAWKEAD